MVRTADKTYVLPLDIMFAQIPIHHREQCTPRRASNLIDTGWPVFSTERTASYTLRGQPSPRKDDIPLNTEGTVSFNTERSISFTKNAQSLPQKSTLSSTQGTVSSTKMRQSPPHTGDSRFHTEMVFSTQCRESSTQIHLHT